MKRRRLLQDLFELRETIRGVQARDYLTRYIRLKERSIQLKKKG